MSRVRFVARCLGMVFAVNGVSDAYAMRVEAHPGLDLVQTYWRNSVFRASRWSTDDETVTQINPALTLSAQGRRVQAELDYRMRNLFYAKTDTNYHRYHQAHGTAHAELVNDTLTVDGLASMNQVFISGDDDLSRSDLLDTPNRTDVAIASVSPQLRLPITNSVEASLGYTRDRVRYEGGDFGDSDGNSVVAAVFSDPSAGRGNWRAEARRTDIDYVSGNTFELTNYRLEADVRVIGSVGVIGRGGYEDFRAVNEGIVTTNPDKDIWSAGVFWNPSRRLYADALYGERYFGNTYSGTVRLATRQTELAIIYREDTFSARQEQIERNSQRGQPGAVPDDALFELPQLTEDVYVRRQLNAVMTRRMRVRSDLRLFYDARDFQTRSGEDRSVGAEATGEYRPTPRTRARGVLYGARAQYAGDVDPIYYWSLELRFAYQFSPVYETSFLFNHEHHERSDEEGKTTNWLVGIALAGRW